MGTPAAKMPQEGERAKAASGREVVYSGGKWNYADEAAPQQAPTEPAGPAPSQRRFVPDAEMETPLSGLGRDLRQSGEEVAQGVLSAVTFGGDDEIAGGVNAAMGGDYEAGRAQAEARKMALQARSEERQRLAKRDLATNSRNLEASGAPAALVGAGRLASAALPSTYGAGEFAGTVAQGAAGGAAVNALRGGAAASTAARVAPVAGSGAVQGGVEGAMNAQPGERLGGAARGAAVGAAISGAMKAPAAIVKGVAKHAPGLARRADIARLRAVGINPAHADELPGKIEGTAETLRKHGVGKGLLTGSGGMERQASAAVDAIEARRGALAANAAGAVTPGSNVAGPIRAAAPRVNKDAAAYYNRKADEFAFNDIERQVPKPRPAAPPAPDRISGLEPTQVASDPRLRGLAGRTPRAKQLIAEIRDGSAHRQGQPPPGMDATMPGGRRPRPAAPPPVPEPPPEMMTVRERVPRDLSFSELQEGRREYSPDNWAVGSQEARAGKDLSQAFSAAEADAVARSNVPSAGAEYRQLGREEAHLLRARKGLLGGADPAAGARAVPLNAHDAARLLTPAGVLGNNKTKLLEAGAGVAKRAASAAPGMTRRAAERAPAGSILAREAVRSIENSEYPEDEYFRQYMSNPDFRFSR